jgi:hypothetical protein
MEHAKGASAAARTPRIPRLGCVANAVAGPVAGQPHSVLGSRALVTCVACAPSGAPRPAPPACALATQANSAWTLCGLQHVSLRMDANHERHAPLHICLNDAVDSFRNRCCIQEVPTPPKACTRNHGAGYLEAEWFVG